MQVTLSHGGLSLSGEHISGGSVINDAQVEAVISFPDLPGRRRWFSPDGQWSVCRGRSTVPPRPGTYSFSVRATGTIAVPGQSGTVQMQFSRQREQSVYVISPFVPDAVLFATRSITIGPGAQILSGSAIVNQAGGLCISETARSLPVSIQCEGGQDRDRGSCRGRRQCVSTISFSNEGTITGARTTPLALPVIPSLPSFEAATVGTADVKVSNGGSKTIAPGRYRDISVGSLGTLT